MMTIRPRAPSLFRPRQPIDQSVLTDNRKLVEDINRRGLLRGAVSLGALTMLTGCDVSEIGLTLEHDPKKWMPVFGKDHAQQKS